MQMAQFKEIQTSTGKSVFILEQRADYKKSMDVLKKNNLRPFTYQEALVRISEDSNLRDSLKGKWFYLDGEGFKYDRLYTFNEKGELAKINDKEAELSSEKKVLTYSGMNSLSLNVCSDFYMCRFILNALIRKADADMIIGVKPSEDAPNVATGYRLVKISPELLAEFRPVVDILHLGAQAGVINPEIAETVKKVLRTLE